MKASFFEVEITLLLAFIVKVSCMLCVKKLMEWCFMDTVLFF